MTAAKDIWTEMGMEAQREMLENLNRQLATYHRAVLQLMAVANRAGAPIADIQAAVEPCWKNGPIPAEEMPLEDTQPLERDAPDYRKEGRPTVAVQPLSMRQIVEGKAS